jgi:tetratricopeptide (TPR) repeat protein
MKEHAVHELTTDTPTIYPLPIDTESSTEASMSACDDHPKANSLTQINWWIGLGLWHPALRALQRNASETTDEGVRAFCYMKAGQIREAMQQWDAARACYEGAVSFDAKHEKVAYLSFNNLGYCLNRLGRPGDAEAACRSAIAIHADRFNAHKNLGVALEALGRLPEAAASFHTAAKIKPSEPVATLRLRFLLANHPEIARTHPHLAEGVDLSRDVYRAKPLRREQRAQPRSGIALAKDVEATLRGYLESIQVDEPLIDGSFQIFGLHWQVGNGLQYQTLDEAMGEKTIEVMETSQTGQVRAIRVVSRSKSRTFLMAGEELIGAKQNRVLNASIVLESCADLSLPVSCVESGRWSYRRPRFDTRGSSSHYALRHMTSRHALSSYRRSGTPESDQGAVWTEVSRMLDERGTKSPTKALHDAYESEGERLDKATERLRPREHWSGAAFALGNRIVGVDLFDKPATLERLWPKLTRAYALQAKGTQEPPELPRKQVEDWVRSSANAVIDAFYSPGLGTDVRLESDHHLAAMLVVEGTPVHLEMFYEDGM